MATVVIIRLLRDGLAYPSHAGRGSLQYQPFTQTNDTVSINHPIKGEITTKILKPNELIKILQQHTKFEIQVLFSVTRERIENQLKEVCSENPLDNLKNKNKEEIVIKLKDPLAEINVINRIPYSIKDVKEFKEECAQLLENGIIRESTSPHSAPAFYVENNNEIKRGKRRMVINYKKMNEATNFSNI